MRLSVQIEFDKILDLDTRKNSVVVGRSKTADLCIPHDIISRQHCRIDLENNKYYITDLESANGVFVDGVRIPPGKRFLYTYGAPLRLGSLECQLTSDIQTASFNKIVSSSPTPRGDGTATIRLARIDLQRKPLKLELESRPPLTLKERNPVAAVNLEAKKRRKRKFSRKDTLISVLVVLLCILFYFFFL